MIINKKLLQDNERKIPPSNDTCISFGTIPTDHMLVCDFLAAQNRWQTPEIKAYEPFNFFPNAVVFHYGQTIFEGMKAYRSAKQKDQVFLFRPEQNAQRMFHSAKRLGMEPFPVDLFLECVKSFVQVEKDWVLPAPGSLYIRPTMIPLDEGISYRASKSYRFFIIASPVKNYFSSETTISVLIERFLSRAALGGTGEAKCGGNYAASIQPMLKAEQKGASQVLWLDAIEHKYIEEAGTMNVMCVYDKHIVTPPLGGTILPGITRSSLLTIALQLGLTVEEKPLCLETVLADAREGRISEMFACGTAAVVSAISALWDGEEKIQIGNGEFGAISRQLRKSLVDLQTGVADDPYGYRVSLF